MPFQLELYDFAKDLLGKVGTDKLAPQPHYEMCDFIETLVQPLRRPPYRNPLQRKKLLMVPRGCFKTTIGSILTCLFVISKNPNVRILISSHSLEASVEILSAIKGYAESDWFIERFGNWKKADDLEADAWRAAAITVAQRTEIYREATITCTGVEQSKMGGHYDLIIADDLADRINTLSEKLRAKTRNHVGGFIPILNPGGSQLVIGTKQHDLDIYYTMIDEDEQRAKKNEKAGRVVEPLQYEKLIRQIWLPNGYLYFPTEFPPEVIEQKRLDCTDEEFSVWYLNEARPRGERIFPRDLLHTFIGQFSTSSGQPIARVTPLA